MFLRITKYIFTGVLLLALACLSPAAAAEKPLIFGTLPIQKPSKLFSMYHPLIDYLQKELGRPIRLEIGKDYNDAIGKFQSGHYDFGYLGPSPYIIATNTSPLGKDNFKLFGTLETKGKPFYHAVIIASKKNSAIQSLADLAGKKFAFGSRKSTLSFYLPAKMLMDAGVIDRLAETRLLGKHDAVANAVAGGAFAAGGIKESVARQFSDRVRVVRKSEPVYDFMLLAHKDMDDALYEKIRTLVLGLKDKQILGKVKKGATGFVPTDDGNYDNLRTIMKEVDAHMGPAK